MTQEQYLQRLRDLSNRMQWVLRATDALQDGKKIQLTAVVYHATGSIPVKLLYDDKQLREWVYDALHDELKDVVAETQKLVDQAGAQGG